MKLYTDASKTVKDGMGVTFVVSEFNIISSKRLKNKLSGFYWRIVGHPIGIKLSRRNWVEGIL